MEPSTMISNGLQLRSVPSRQRNQSIRYSYAFFLIGTYLILACWSFSKSAQVINHPPRLVKAAYGSSQHVLSPSNAVANVTKQRDHFSFENSTLRSAGTFVIQVRGEMGNNLQRIAYGHALKWYAEDEFQFSPQLLLRHLKKPKWRIARGDIYQCFPLLRSLDYEGALQPKFVRVQKGNHPWLAEQTKEWVDHLSLVKDESLRNISLGLGAMKQLAMIEHRPHPDYPILVLGGPMRNVLIDKYYQRFREALFEFDNGNGCCAQIPESDEVVFHFRHFAKELSTEEEQSRGFEELDPELVATQLMGHLHSGQKVAITTRFANDPIMEVYERAMQERGFHVRVISNQTGVQDFCFLLRAQQELLGVAKSTYARWAAYLGDAKQVQLYALDNPGSTEFIHQTMRFPWSHPELKRRIRFPVFSSQKAK